MNAKEARKLAEEIKPIQDEKDRKAAAVYAEYLLKEAAKKRAEEERIFEDRYAEITKQIDWAAKKGRTEVEIDRKYADDKLNILKRLHSDGYKAYESKRYFEDWHCNSEGYPEERFTAERDTYKVEW